MLLPIDDRHLKTSDQCQSNTMNFASRMAVDSVHGIELTITLNIERIHMQYYINDSDQQ